MKEKEWKILDRKATSVIQIPVQECGFVHNKGKVNKEDAKDIILYIREVIGHK